MVFVMKQICLPFLLCCSINQNIFQSHIDTVNPNAYITTNKIFFYFNYRYASYAAQPSQNYGQSAQVN